MLSKKTFLAKHAAKYAGLPAAEKERRYKQYLSSAATPSGTTVARIPRGPRPTKPRGPWIPNTPARNGLTQALLGCGTDYPALDDTAVLRGSNHNLSSATVDASGNVGFCLIPGALFTNSSVIYNAPTFVSSVVTSWGAGSPIAAPVSLNKSRIIGASVSIYSTTEPLNLSGYWSACIFMPDNSAAYWPVSTSNVMLRPQSHMARAYEKCDVVMPPAPENILRVFNDNQTVAVAEKLVGHPALCYIGAGFPPSSTILIDICWSWELTSGSAGNADAVLLSQHPPMPGMLQQLSDTISSLGSQAFSYLAANPQYAVRAAAVGYNAARTYASTQRTYRALR